MLVGKYIFNLIVKPFNVSHEYAQTIYDQTSLPKLDKVLKKCQSDLLPVWRQDQGSWFWCDCQCSGCHYTCNPRRHIYLCFYTFVWASRKHWGCSDQSHWYSSRHRCPEIEETCGRDSSFQVNKDQHFRMRFSAIFSKSDLQQEFASAPEKGEELSLEELGSVLGSGFSGALSKYSMSLISRLIGGRMPGGFNLSTIKS